jgi:6-phosphofructo-2-kinase/fructose-2,6-biphosphatase 4
MAAPLYTGRTESGRLYHAGQILISTVGLPARGKTHSGKALERYLTWLGVKVRVFSLGDYRRSVLGTKIALPDDYFSRSHRSEATAKLRQSILDGMEQIIEEWFQKENGQVAIYDANVGLGVYV